MKYPLFNILISVSYLLLAIRLAQFLEIQENGIENIPVNFYPVYSNLQLRTATDHNLLNDLLTNTETKTLNTQESNTIEGLLTYEEAGLSLKAMKNNRSPGSDGFSAEFF